MSGQILLFTLSVDDCNGDVFSLTVQSDKSIDPTRICALVSRALSEMSEALDVFPEKSLRDIELLPGVERRLVLEAWNTTTASYASKSLLHELFSARASACPEEISAGL